MDTPTKKKELIEWIKNLQNDALLDKMYNVKSNYSGSGKSKREFGCGKKLFGNVSEDFNEPLDMFKPYTK